MKVGNTNKGARHLRCREFRERLRMRKVVGFLFAVCLAPGVFAQTPGGPVLTVTVTLSPAQVQQLRATPVTLVAAAGPGTYINPLSAVIEYKPGSTPYSVPNYGVFCIDRIGRQ